MVLVVVVVVEVVDVLGASLGDGIGAVLPVQELSVAEAGRPANRFAHLLATRRRAHALQRLFYADTHNENRQWCQSSSS